MKLSLKVSNFYKIIPLCQKILWNYLFIKPWKFTHTSFVPLPLRSPIYLGLHTTSSTITTSRPECAATAIKSADAVGILKNRFLFVTVYIGNYKVNLHFLLNKTNLKEMSFYIKLFDKYRRYYKKNSSSPPLFFFPPF